MTTRILKKNLLLLVLLVVPVASVAAEKPDDATVTNWAATAMQEVMTFDYKNYTTVHSNARKYFTAHGIEDFDAAIKKSRLLEMIEVNQMSSTLKLAKEPAIETQGIEKDTQTWFIQTPVTITYSDGWKKDRMDNLLVTLTIKQSSEAENTDGLGIDQWIMVPQ